MIGVFSFPRVVEVERIEDTGPDSGARCPHCGADGRYITWFVTEDGAHRGAMRGCYSLFPQSRYAARVAKILAKERNGRRLAGWDQMALDAIRSLATRGSAEVDRALRDADLLKHNWIAARYGGHR
jgi:hypothetical protein